MSVNNSKQVAVWMDSMHATVLAREHVDSGQFIVSGHVNNEDAGWNTSEKAAHNLERTLQHKFYKEILKLIPNVDEIYVTGPGEAQEQFSKFLKETPQYKNARVSLGTASKMDDERLLELAITHFRR
jgi:stalled ribosome rescue protein Dom34